MTEWYSPDRKPPAARTKRAVGELLWEVYVDHVFWRAELFDEQEYGFDVRLFRGGDFFGSHRWENREAAIAWANERLVESRTARRDYRGDAARGCCDLRD
jgi:hypothetical protein